MLRVSTKSRTVLFLERLKVRKNRAKKGAIYRVSGLIARTTKSSLRVRPGSARPGAIPHAHTRGGLRVIQFAVDRNSSIIGPVRFPRSRQYNEPIPAIHEFGKLVIDQKGRIRKYPARPYMSKALKRLRGKIPREFSASVARII